MAIVFPPGDTKIQYFKAQYDSTGDRRVIGALSGYMRGAYPSLVDSQYDYYLATCNYLGAAA